MAPEQPGHTCCGTGVATGFARLRPRGQGYKPVALELKANPNAVFQPASYPESKVLLLPAISERVPVFEGKFRIARRMSSSPLRREVFASGSRRGLRPERL